MDQPKEPKMRFGIGEWYGYNLNQIESGRIKILAAEALKSKREQKLACPFNSRKEYALCNKLGGVCSLRLYSAHTVDNTNHKIGIPASGRAGDFRATCPYRFYENLDVFRWVGEVILDDPDALLAGEVGFLESDPSTDSDGGRDVGRFDMILVSTKTPKEAPMAWAALEIQAVYFSGNAMKSEFEAYRDSNQDGPMYPIDNRRPDYRSSGPKRLMPQLQTKVPTLRRWGKKMAVVVDRAFFDSIGEMDSVGDISNADIAWFIVNFEEIPKQERARIKRDEVRYTTLERSVEGLTGGKPVALKTFETRIVDKLNMDNSKGRTAKKKT